MIIMDRFSLQLRLTLDTVAAVGAVMEHVLGIAVTFTYVAE